MLSLHKFAWAKISACNVIPRFIVPVQINRRNFSIAQDDDLPPKPKRPPTPFLVYFQESRTAIKKEYPDATYKDMMLIAGEKWRACSPELKKQYEESFKKAKEDYFYQINNYEASLTEKQKAIAEEQSAAKAEKREKSRLKKGMRKLGRPKCSPNAFALFFSTKKGMKISGESKLEWNARVVSEWNNLPEIEKKPFFDRAKELRVQYEKDIDVWRKEALKVESADPLVKKAQKVVALQNERHQEKLLNGNPKTDEND